MEPFGQSIWTMDGDDVRMFGVLPFATRMTVVQLQTGGIWIHSPVRPTPERQRAVDALGPVQHIVAPNKIHSLGVLPWKSLYPAARVWVSPGFNDRHPDIEADGLLSNDGDAPWRDEIDHCAMAGHAVLDEVVFLHKASTTLIVTDLIQKHVAARETWLWRGVKGMAGILGEDGGVPLDVRLSVKGKSAMRHSVETVLAWDFDNLIISHGHCLQGGAKPEVSRVFEWIASS